MIVSEEQARLGSRPVAGRKSRPARELVIDAFFGPLANRLAVALLPLHVSPAAIVLASTGFNLAELYRVGHGGPRTVPAASGGAVERALEATYRVAFGWHDRLLRSISTKRLECVLRGGRDSLRRRAVTLAYHDRATMGVVANLGLSTQLVVLGACLVLDLPELYLWLVVASAAFLPLLQLRRESLARRALSARRGA